MLLGLSSLRVMFGKSGFREGMGKGREGSWVGRNFNGCNGDVIWIS